MSLTPILALQVPTRFGHWTILRSGRFALCRCDCGTEKTLYMRDVIKGKSSSCGCKKGELVSRRKTEHGHGSWRKGKRIPEYVVWKGMRARCNNSNHPRFMYYGGRGIKVCERWDDFANFLADMGRRPLPNLTVERVNNNGDYEPTNCKWATRKEQSNNQRPRRIGCKRRSSR